jgi:peptidyl-tRNA hydrolase
MTMQTYTGTLTRWHKVTERLTKEFNELTKSARQGLTETSVTEYLGESQEIRLAQYRDDCLAKLERALLIQDTVTYIRQALGEANERQGVSRSLAEYDKLLKRANILSAITSAQDAQRVEIGELKNVKYPARSEEWRDRGQTKIAVALLEGELLAAMKARTEAATAAMYAQADQLAELNKTPLSLDLPADIARIAGL